MWQEKFSSWNGKQTEFRSRYFINSNLVCDIMKIEFDILKKYPISNSDLYYHALVFSPKNYNHEEKFFIKDKDLDVLKLKCLLKARELGWNISYLY